MGIVIKQSFKNTITTYLGFGLGAINTLFLYTRFMSDEYYGLVAYILSTANIMMPLMAFGVHNTIIKFYSSFKTKNTQNSFMTLMLFLPLALTLPVGLSGLFGYEWIAGLLSKKNIIVKDYLWHIFLIALAMAYFEVFFAWAKVQMRSVFGNFLKEVFHRVGAMILLFALFFDWITISEFFMGLVGVYLLRMLFMLSNAFYIRLPVFRFDRINGLSEILKYSGLIIIAGSVATILLDIDKFMLNNYIQIEKVAYYSVAVFIAMVIAVPQRAMHQILMPLTAQFINENKTEELFDLYKRSSLTLFVISGFIFLLIVLNINELYAVIPEEFSGGLVVVFLVSIAKLYDNLLGNNNAMLFNSEYYRMVLVFGVLLALLAVILNMILIPKFGLEGSALATMLAVLIYNTVKVLFVQRKFKMLPFTFQTFQIAILITVCAVAFYFWDFPFNPYVNIILKSIVIAVVYGFLILKLKISQDISEMINAFTKFR